ncbi:MAG: hypothetical protein IV100_05820 [Myxococcales bacterium]|nr:hypothetical protein [Myxococcales bacterium]
MQFTTPSRAEFREALSARFGTTCPDADNLSAFVRDVPGFTVRLERVATLHGFDTLAAFVPLVVTPGCVEERCALVFDSRAFEFEPHQSPSLSHSFIAARLVSLDARAATLKACLTR